LPDKDQPIPLNEGGRTADSLDDSGFSTQSHNAPPPIPDAQVTVRYAQGASSAEIKLRKRTGATIQSRGRGGRRSEIQGFSRASQRRLRRLTAEVPRDSRALFATLTYPTWYRIDPETAKRYDLEKFKKRFERKFGRHAVIWRQEAGDEILHFHLLLYFDRRLTIPRVRLAEIREWVARTWWEVCGRICEEHLEAGTSVEKPRSLLKVMKYISKSEPPRNGTDYSGDGPSAHAGRRWGVWRKELLGIVWVVTRVAPEDAFQLRRHLRQLLSLNNRPGVVTFRVFIRDHQIKRLLTLLGYPAPS
jgi:hypothetical protein